MLYSLDEQLEQAEELSEKVRIIEDQLDQKILELKDLVAQSEARRAHNGKCAGLVAQLEEDLRNFKALLDSCPEQIETMLQTLQEMKNGSEPDESADYWEEKRKIDQNTSDLKVLREKFDKFEKVYQKKKVEIAKLCETQNRAQDLKAL